MLSLTHVEEVPEMWPGLRHAMDELVFPSLGKGGIALEPRPAVSTDDLEMRSDDDALCATDGSCSGKIVCFTGRVNCFYKAQVTFAIKRVGGVDFTTRPIELRRFPEISIHITFAPDVPYAPLRVHPLYMVSASTPVIWEEAQLLVSRGVPKTIGLTGAIFRGDHTIPVRFSAPEHNVRLLLEWMGQLLAHGTGYVAP